MATPLLTALYYPHSSIASERLVKSALLLWDQLEWLVPQSGFTAHSPLPSRPVQAALEMIGRQRVPTDQEKRLAHDEIMKLTEERLPEWLLFDPREPGGAYYAYEDKLLYETWTALRDAGLAVRVGKARDGHIQGGALDDWAVSTSLGLTIMSILADICAGTQRRTVTDRADAYAAHTRAVTFAFEGEYGSKTSDEAVSLVTVAAKMVNVDLLAVEDLVALRVRESQEKSKDLRDLRHRFVKTMDDYIAEITNKKVAADAEEVYSKYTQEMERDLTVLKRELRNTAIGAVTKEVLIGAAAFVGAMAVPFIVPAAAAASPYIGIGELVRTGFAYRQKRAEVMRNHAMAWLHVASEGDAMLTLR
jgi:hypothetical protein